MRGLLSFYRGLYTPSNRQARRKAGIVGSRCGFCGTQSNSKVRFKLLLRLGLGKQYVVDNAICCWRFVLLVAQVARRRCIQRCMQLSQMRMGFLWRNNGGSNTTTDVAYCVFSLRRKYLLLTHCAPIVFLQSQNKTRKGLKYVIGRVGGSVRSLTVTRYPSVATGSTYGSSGESTSVLSVC